MAALGLWAGLMGAQSGSGTANPAVVLHDEIRG